MPLHITVDDGVSVLTLDYQPHNTLDMAAVEEVSAPGCRMRQQ